MAQTGKIKLALIEDDEEALSSLIEQLNKTNDFIIVGTARDGKKGLKIINQNEADIVLMNILMPKISGLSILESLKENKTRKKPSVIIFITTKTEHLATKALELGADHLVYKPFDFKMLLGRIAKVYKARHVDVNLYKDLINSNENANYNNPEKYISAILTASGFQPNLKGFTYLKSAILLELANREELKSITKSIYPKIAKKYDTTASCVERAMRNAIDKSWRKDGGIEINKILGVSPDNDKRPSNSLFIKSFIEVYDNINLT